MVLGKGVTPMVWRIGEAARRAGVTAHALRHYEALGLLRPRRTASGQRVYTEEDLRRVGFIRRAAAVGFTLAEVGEVLRLRESGQVPCRWVRAKLEEKVAAIEARIAELERLRAELLALQEVPVAEAASAEYCSLLECADGRGTGKRPTHARQARYPRQARWAWSCDTSVNLRG